MGKTDPSPPFNFEAYLNFLQQYNHNFIRMWTWELSTYTYDGKLTYAEPFPWRRTGPGTALDGKLREFQAEGKLGDVHFVRASTQGEITDMDTHLMDLVLLAVGDAPPTAVWAAIEGGETYRHAYLNCPENLMAIYTFTGGIRVFFESTQKALGTADFPDSNPRCNIDIWAHMGSVGEMTLDGHESQA
jgi:hypothetical protein